MSWYFMISLICDQRSATLVIFDVRDWMFLFLSSSNFIPILIMTFQYTTTGRTSMIYSYKDGGFPWIFMMWLIRYRSILIISFINTQSGSFYAFGSSSLFPVVGAALSTLKMSRSNIILMEFNHGIMGTPMPKKFSYLRLHPDGKYTTYNTPGWLIQFLICDWSAEISWDQ